MGCKGPLAWRPRREGNRKRKKKKAPETQVKSPLAELAKGPGGCVPARVTALKTPCKGKVLGEREQRTCSLPLRRSPPSSSGPSTSSFPPLAGCLSSAPPIPLGLRPPTPNPPSSQGPFSGPRTPKWSLIHSTDQSPGEGTVGRSGRARDPKGLTDWSGRPSYKCRPCAVDFGGRGDTLQMPKNS